MTGKNTSVKKRIVLDMECHGLLDRSLFYAHNTASNNRVRVSTQ